MKSWILGLILTLTATNVFAFEGLRCGGNALVEDDVVNAVYIKKINGQDFELHYVSESSSNTGSVDVVGMDVVLDKLTCKFVDGEEFVGHCSQQRGDWVNVYRAIETEMDHKGNAVTNEVVHIVAKSIAHGRLSKDYSFSRSECVVLK